MTDNFQTTKNEADGQKQCSALSTDCLGIVLAGGKSTRMGTDKATLLRNGENMHTFSRSLLQSIGVKNVVISTNQNQTIEGTRDKIANAGPLGGIFSVLQQHRPKAALILPIDLPLMTQETLAHLKMVGEISGKACCFEDAFLPLYLPNNAQTELFFAQAFRNFTGKGPSIRSLLKQVPHEMLAPKHKSALFNSNTPQDWEHAKTQFSISRNLHVSD